MKRKFTYRIFIFSVWVINSGFWWSASAQTTQGINYQAVARDASGNPLVSQTLTSVRFVIHKNTASGTAMYDVTHSSVATNPFGLLNLVIGVGGTVNSGNLATIPWGSDVFFLEVIVNGTNMGTTQFLSVPYAQHSTTADSLTSLPPGVLIWKRNADSVFLNSTTNKVGIGTISPKGKLDVSVASGNTDALNVSNSGSGRAGVFWLSNTANDSAALISYTKGKREAVFGISQGTGHGGVFAVDNSGSIGCGLIASTNGGGKAVFGLQKGMGYGGAFMIDNAANDSAAVIGFTNGTAISQAIYGLNQGLGNAGVFHISNASNSKDALFATTNGTGKAANFTITSASSTSPALQVAVSNSAAPSAIFLGGNVGVRTASPNSTLHVNGSVSAAVRSTTSSTTLTDSDYFIIINGAGTVTLPAANTCPGRIYIIKNLSPSTTWNISPAIINTNGNPDLTINAGAIVPLISDGTDWQGW